MAYNFLRIEDYILEKQYTLERQAQTKVVVAVAWSIVVAISDATVGSIAAPANATIHAIGAITRRGIVTAIVIRTPFPHVPAHVVNAQFIIEFLRHRVSG